MDSQDEWRPQLPPWLQGPDAGRAAYQEPPEPERPAPAPQPVQPRKPRTPPRQPPPLPQPPAAGPPRPEVATPPTPSRSTQTPSAPPVEARQQEVDEAVRPEVPPARPASPATPPARQTETAPRAESVQQPSPPTPQAAAPVSHSDVPPAQPAWNGLPEDPNFARGDAHSTNLAPASVLSEANLQRTDGGKKFRKPRDKAESANSRKEHVESLVGRIRRPLNGQHRVAVMALKGGVGKTTTSVTVGSVLASLRGDRVIAVDANPDRGTLAGRVSAQPGSTVRGLLADPNVLRYADMRRHTTQAASKLEAIVSERDPAVSESFGERDYRRVVDVLNRYYSITITDCGTGLVHSAMAGVLSVADSVLLVTSPAVDGAQSASATLDWLELHGHSRLAREAVVAVSVPQPGVPPIDVDKLRLHFASRTRATHVIPYDRHLAEGGVIDLERLQKKTRIALLELTASVADGFDQNHSHRRH